MFHCLCIRQGQAVWPVRLQVWQTTSLATACYILWPATGNIWRCIGEQIAACPMGGACCLSLLNCWLLSIIPIHLVLCKNTTGLLYCCLLLLTPSVPKFRSHIKLCKQLAFFRFPFTKELWECFILQGRLDIIWHEEGKCRIAAGDAWT